MFVLDNAAYFSVAVELFSPSLSRSDRNTTTKDTSLASDWLGQNKTKLTIDHKVTSELSKVALKLNKVKQVEDQ